jgi:cell division topological specificity factor
LQILLAHERQDRSQPEYLPLLQRDILDVIRKYMDVTSENVEVRLQRGERMSTLEIGIELPAPRLTRKAASAAAG